MESGTQNQRFFIGVRIPEAIGRSLITAVEPLAELFIGRFTKHENQHVTLKFLGSIDDDTLREVEAALASVAFRATVVKIEGFGTFSNRIVWAHISGLNELQRSIDDALTPWFEPERRFMSHVTIARMSHMDDRLRSALGSLRMPLSWRVDGFELIGSTLEPSGARYATIARYQEPQDIPHKG